MAVDHKLLTLDAPATGCGFAGNVLAVGDGDGNVHLCAPDGDVQSRKLHDGAILAMATDEKSSSVYTAGDDGKLIRVVNDGEPEALHENRKWVDTVAASARGHVAWTTGKTIHLLRKGADEPIDVTAPSSISGLAFSPDGKWLGAAVYGGALLVQLSDPSKTRMLGWQGSHLAIGFSPDGRFCVTAMLENALHVWRIDKPEDKHGRMGGYPAKPLSFDWTADGRFLATTGADVLVMWPFTGSDGPIGQQAGVFAADVSVLSRTICARPRSMHMAIGYVDGSVMLHDRKAQQYRPLADASDRGPVTGLTFNASGTRLGFIREGGEAGLIELGKA